MSNFDLQYVDAPNKTRILGLAFPMRLDGVGGYASQNENLHSLRDGLIQLIMTSPGERVFRPDFGTNVRSMLFEPINETMVTNMKNDILTAIGKYEPRVIIKSLDIIPIYEDNKVYIRLLATSKNNLLNTANVELIL